MDTPKFRKRQIKKAKESKERRLRELKLKISGSLPLGAIVADENEMNVGGSYGPFPKYYVDTLFNCSDCGMKLIWTAEQQKWWYEVAKGYIFSRAAKCDECRKKVKAEKQAQKKQMEKLKKTKPHKNESFFMKRF